MNHERRVRLVQLRNDLEELAQLEEDAFFNLPESLQAAPRCQLLEANYEVLQEVVQTLDGVIDS